MPTGDTEKLMKYLEQKINIVDLAYDIIDMHKRLIEQERQIERLKEYENKYNQLLNDSIKQSNHMIGNYLTMLLSKGEK